MDDEQHRHAEEVLRINQRRLHKLEAQAALKGSDTLPHVLIEIEDARAEITRLQAELEQRLPSSEPVIIPAHSRLPRASHRTNLPAPATTLVGRTHEVADVCALVRRADVRLVTLTGPAGVGKTRLAIQVATELLDEFPDGVWFVNLAPITDIELVLPTIEHTLGGKERGSQPLLESLTSYLRDRHLALVLDNFEHLIDAASLLGQLLAAAPGLKLLVTSRDVLRVYGEHEVTVLPLNLLDDTRQYSPDQLLQSDAIRLFVARALAVRPDFTLSHANAAAVATICRRVDGLPLAIELAAARIKLFAPPALLARLESRLKTLTSGARDRPIRQQTLRGALDWSYNLLDEGEQLLFARLSVFVGGCSAEATEVVCQVDNDLPLDILEGIVGLADKSLVRQETDLETEPRFAMLETIREYALERLEQRGELELLRRRHADYYLRVVEAMEPHLRGAEQLAGLERLEQEHDNIRAALSWSVTTGDIEIGLRLAGALWPFWGMRGYLDEGQSWLGTLLSRSAGMKQTPARAKALIAAGDFASELYDPGNARKLLEEGLAISQVLGDAGNRALALKELSELALLQGNSIQAEALSQESLALFRAIGDPVGSAWMLGLLGRVAYVQGDIAAARRYEEESLAIHRAQGNKWSMSIMLNSLGETARWQGDDHQAEMYYSESLSLNRALNHKEGVMIALQNLGCVAQHRGDIAQAAAHFRASLTLAQELGKKLSAALSLAGLAGVAATYRQSDRAARLLGASEALFEAIGAILDSTDQADYDHSVAMTRTQLDEATFAAAWKAGRAMSLEQAITEAMELGEAS